MSIIKSTTKQNENKFRIHTITLFNSPPLNSKVTNILRTVTTMQVTQNQLQTFYSRNKFTSIVTTVQ